MQSARFTRGVTPPSQQKLLNLNFTAPTLQTNFSTPSLRPTRFPSSEPSLKHQALQAPSPKATQAEGDSDPMVLSTFRSPESAKKSGRKSFGGEGRDREVPVHMDQIILSLSSLASQYSDLKTKYLASRRFALQRFFVVDNALLLASSFAEWKFMSSATKASRRHSLIVDQLYQERDAHTTLRGDMESAFEKKVNDLEQDVRKSVAVTEEKSKKSMGRLKDEAKANKAECEKLRKENEKLQVRLKQQGMLMESVINQLQVDPERPTRPPEPVPDAGNESYIKYKLHELLSEVDTKYVPPLNYSLLDAPTVNPARTSAMLGCINVLSPPTSPNVRTLPPSSPQG